MSASQSSRGRATVTTTHAATAAAAAAAASSSSAAAASASAVSASPPDASPVALARCTMVVPATGDDVSSTAPVSIVSLLWQLRRSPRHTQLLLVEHVRSHYLTQGAWWLASCAADTRPGRLVVHTAERVRHVSEQCRRTLTTLRSRLHDATIGRVQRSVPYRCAAAYASMIAADAQVARQLHNDAARDAAHSSSFISSTSSSCSLSPLPPGSNRLTAVGWRARRFVYALARFSGQSRKLMFGRPVRYWPIDAAMLYFQLLLLFLPAPDAHYDNVRESLLECLRWYEQSRRDQDQGQDRDYDWGQDQHRPAEAQGDDDDGDAFLERLGYEHRRGGSSMGPQVEGAPASTHQRDSREYDSFLAELSQADSASPARLLMRVPGEMGMGASTDARPSWHWRTDESSPINLPSDVDGSTAASTPMCSPLTAPSTGLPSFAPSPVPASSPPLAMAGSLLQLPSSASASASASVGRTPRHGRYRSYAPTASHTGASHRSFHQSRNLSMDSMDSSHSQAVYHRALELLAREGIDLNNISMNESGEDSDAESWDSGISHSAPRELHFVDGHTDSETEDAAVGAAAAAASYPRFEYPVATSVILESNEAAETSERNDLNGSSSSVAELDRTDEPGSRATPEGGRRTRRIGGRPAHDVADGTVAAAAAPVPSAVSAPLPRLVLPLHIHAATHQLPVTRHLLDSLRPMVAQLCASHSVAFDVLNDDLRSWNEGLVEPVTGTGSAAAAATSSSAVPAIAAVTVPPAARPPPFRLIVHHLSRGDPRAMDELVRRLDAITAHEQVVVASSFFLVVLQTRNDTDTDSADASVRTLLTRSSHRHPLLQALCTSAPHQLTLLQVEGSRLDSDDAQQHSHLHAMAEALLQAAERGLIDLQAQ